MPHVIAPEDRKIEELLVQFAATRDPHIREVIIERNERLVRLLANRFVRPGVPLEDLVQIAWVGLMQAVDQFDPSKGVAFSSYAVPTILGVIKRYFRDKNGGYKVPRRLQQLASGIDRLRDRLVQQLGREPTHSEMAQHLEVSEEVLSEAMSATKAHIPTSLNELLSWDEDSTLDSTLGYVDRGFSTVENSTDLERALARLSGREQTILRLLFWEELPQQEVARRLGISQMQVCRLQRLALRRLRGLLAEEPGKNSPS